MRFRTILATMSIFLLITGCGGDSSSSDASEPQPPTDTQTGPEPLGYSEYENSSVFELKQGDDGHSVGMLTHGSNPDNRFLLKLNSSGEAFARYTPEDGFIIIDCTFHLESNTWVVLGRSRAIDYESSSFGLVVLDNEDLSIIDSMVLSDPEVINDAIYEDTIENMEPAAELKPCSYHYDAGKLRIFNNTLYLLLRTSTNSVILYAYGFYDPQALPELMWRKQIQHGLYIANIGGIETVTNYNQYYQHFRVFLDADDQNNLYIGIPFSYENEPYIIESHNELFKRNLPSDDLTRRSSGTLLIQLNENGDFLSSCLGGEGWTYGMRFFQDSIYLAGCSRKIVDGTSVNSWNAYLCRVDVQNETLLFPENYYNIGSEAQGAIFKDIAVVGDRVFAVGSHLWTQYENGISEVSEKLLVEFSPQGEVIRQIPMPAGPRHNLVNAVLPLPEQNSLLVGGHENGPGNYTGEEDFSEFYMENIDLNVFE